MVKAVPDTYNKRRFLKIFWITGICIFIFPVVFIFLVSIFGDLPTTDQLENPKTPIASEVYSSDGVLLGKFFNENRSPIDFEHLGKNLVNALVATEDARFYHHSGVDFRGLGRVFFKTFLLRQGSGGGSTITQQLAKNLFPREKFHNPFSFGVRKIKEWILASRLESFYTKEELLFMYFNTVDFGSNAYGIKSAAKTFFNKEPMELSLAEAATLVGMLKAPTYYSPIVNPGNSTLRRNVVLGQLYRYDYISKVEFEKLKSSPLILDYNVESHNEGLATYLREYVKKKVKPWAEEAGLDIYADGLKIYTGIDSKMQLYAEESVHQVMKENQSKFYSHWKGSIPWKDNPGIIDSTVKRSERYRALKSMNADGNTIMRAFNTERKMKIWSWKGEKDTVMSPLDSIKYYKYFLHTGFMVMDPTTGQVRAWVGGTNFKYFKYDHVDPKAKRQVGSTFKPFVYTVAIENGYSPCLKVPNIPVVFEKYDNWSPKNSEDKYGGEKTLTYGLMMSINCITAWVMKQVGVEPVVALAHRMGITSTIQPYPSLCLGTADISVFEMTSAFNTYNNKGSYIEPVVITKVEDRFGNVIPEISKRLVPKMNEALDEKYAYIMIQMLRSVVDHGTGYWVRGKYQIKAPMAGKTGTTQNQSDAWFMSFVPQLTGGCWVGAEDRAVHFRTVMDGAGGAVALPVWAVFMQKVYADKTLGIDPERNWEKPEGDLDVELDCSKYDNEKGEETTQEFY